MSSKVFKDNVFPTHVSDLMTIMHMMVFNGTDGEDNWDTYLSLDQKECIALGLAIYYQCEHCIEYHAKALSRVRKIPSENFIKNMNSIILFLRTDLRAVTESEQTRWLEAWDQFAHKLSLKRGESLTPYLIGLAIGIARDDKLLIEIFGKHVTKKLKNQKINPQAAIGELESVVIFMKAAVSKNRVAHKIEKILN